MNIKPTLLVSPVSMGSVNFTLNQGKWDTSSLNCKSTTEFLDGCSIFLNKISCVKQLGTTSGELSKCNFTNFN